MGLIAYHGKQEIKDFYVKRVHGHFLADEIIKGKYWQDGKGCAVGCCIHSGEHSKYETELGIPEWLARVEDTIFEGLPNEQAKLWPGQFLEAIKPGVDLEKVKTPFIIFILEENLKTLDGLPDMTEWPDVKNAVNLTREATKEVIRCHREGTSLSTATRAATWSAACSGRSAAWSAACSGRSAAWSAGRSAESAAWSAESAAWSAAGRSAESAAWSAGSAGSAARAARSAEWSGRSAAYEKYADKLLELLRECPT